MDELLTTEQAAELAGVTRVTVLRWIKKGYLGDAYKQNVSRGRKSGYLIKQSDLNRYVHGWTFEREDPKPEPKVEKLAKAEPLKDIDRKSLETAANNLKIAIEFAQEELSKILDLL